jgi:hypothetical protein
LNEEINKLNKWSDYTDPSSGYPVISERGGLLYNDVEGCEIILRYNIEYSGGCRLISHPNWKYNVYPATFFTTCSFDELIDILNKKFN